MVLSVFSMIDSRYLLFVLSIEIMSIASLFRPLQPGIFDQHGRDISYVEMPPAPDLKEYIYCYWQLKTKTPLDQPYLYRVVSDGCIDILFESCSINHIYITGFSRSYIEYNLGSKFDYIGIRFLPTGFPLLFNLPASAFTNKFLNLAEYLPNIVEQIAQSISVDQDLSEHKKAFNLCFLSCLEKSKSWISPDTRVFRAMDEILKARGCIDINALDVGLSQRQLRRLFQFYYGESPKTFCQIVRFQNILNSELPNDDSTSNKLYYDLGYYDQAHFIKEFKNFYGVTPSRAFGLWAP